MGRVWRGDKTVTVRWKGGDTAGNVVEMASAGRGGCSGWGGRSLDAQVLSLQPGR